MAARITQLVKLPTAGGEPEVRVFSLRGAHLRAMFSRTERAAEFRRWVLGAITYTCNSVTLARAAALPAPAADPAWRTPARPAACGPVSLPFFGGQHESQR